MGGSLTMMIRMYVRMYVYVCVHAVTTMMLRLTLLLSANAAGETMLRGFARCA